MCAKQPPAPLPGVSYYSGHTHVLPRSQLVADDTRVGDDLTQPQFQVDLALKGTRIEGHRGTTTQSVCSQTVATSAPTCVHRTPSSPHPDPRDEDGMTPRGLKVPIHPAHWASSSAGGGETGTGGSECTQPLPSCGKDWTWSFQAFFSSVGQSGLREGKSDGQTLCPAVSPGHKDQTTSIASG